MQQQALVVRDARLDDAASIAALTAQYARDGIMLERSAENVVENIHNFFVAELEGNVVGCCAVAFYTEKLAEIRSVAVAESYKRQGVGCQLIEKAEAILQEDGVVEVFVLTLSREFFLKLGYTEIRKEYFPQKIWKDCTHCPKLMACDEIAMVKNLSTT